MTIDFDGPATPPDYQTHVSDGIYDHMEFVSDESLARMFEVVRQEDLNATQRRRKLIDGFMPEQLELTTRWGYRSEKVQRALAVVRGEPLDPAPCITERLKACLYALSTDTDKAPTNAALFAGDDMARMAQDQLNELLLEHPVLMYPLLRLHIYENTVSGTASVPHAIALSRRGRFPMVGDKGVTPERLREWLGHVCVQTGLTSQPMAFVRMASLIAGQTPADVGNVVRHHPTWLLASLQGLSDLVHQPGDPASLFAGKLLKEAEACNWNSSRGANALMRALFGATGVHDGRTCPALLESWKRHGIAGIQGLVDAMLEQLPRYLAGGMGVDVHGDVAERTRLLINGLVTAGFAATPEESSRMVCVAIGRHGCRKLDVPEVLQFLREVIDAGTDLLDNGAPLLHDLRSTGLGLMWQSQEFLTAAEVLRNERLMLDVIHASAAETAAPRARRRAGI